MPCVGVDGAAHGGHHEGGHGWFKHILLRRQSTVLIQNTNENHNFFFSQYAGYCAYDEHIK